MSKEVFGYRLASARKAMGLSQAELSKKLNVSQAAIAKQETGKNFPSIELLEDYADFFNVSTDYLLGRVDIPNGYLVQKEKLPTSLVDSGVEAVTKIGAPTLTVQEESVLKLFAQQLLAQQQQD